MGGRYDGDAFDELDSTPIDGSASNYELRDRKSVVQGKSVDRGGRRIIKKKQ